MENNNYTSPKKILVTGGSGFIGTNLVEAFISSGDIVLNIDSKPPRNQAQKQYWQQVDILDSDNLKKAVKDFNPDYIYHMAARTDLDGRTVEDYSSNTDGIQNLIAAIRGLNQLKRIIFASSRMVCRIDYRPKNEFDYCPTTRYGESKVLGENIVRESKSIPCSWAIVRPTSIWGPWFDIPYKTFFMTVARGQYFHPGRKNILKSFGFIGNSVHELERLMHADAESVHSKTFYLEDYPPIDVKEMANCIQAKMGVRVIRNAPLALLRIGAFVGDALKFMGWKNPPLTSFRLDNLLTNMVYDSTQLENIVGTLPYTMEQGVAQTVDWMCKHGEISGMAGCNPEAENTNP